MQRCLQLAANGKGQVAPNPLVGAVLVHRERVIGEGFHRAWGGPHAEVHAIRSCSSPGELRNATLYVNLEPCAHHGKTPPCADLIVASGIPRVVIANGDPNPLVNGKGTERLRAAGCEVKTGVCAEQAHHLNRRFFTFQKKKRPYIVLKWAQTGDGFMDLPRKHKEKGVHWITGAKSQLLVHKWRTEEAAILVGSHTFTNDQPALTNRFFAGKSPLRIVLGALEGASRELPFFQMTAPVLLVMPIAAMNSNRWDQLHHVRQFGYNAQALPELLAHLYTLNIQSLLVEGGAHTLQSFLDSGLWDEARVFTNENLHWKQGLAAPVINGSALSTDYVGNDRLQVFFAR